MLYVVEDVDEDFCNRRLLEFELAFLVNFMSCNVNCFFVFIGVFCFVGERDLFVGEVVDWEDFFGVVGVDLTFFLGLLDLSSSSDKIIWSSSRWPFWDEAIKKQERR